MARSRKWAAGRFIDDSGASVKPVILTFSEKPSEVRLTARAYPFMTGFSILALGFALGMRHATDADHLAAIATLATRECSREQALRHGLAWGIGHTLTLLVLGGSALALGESLPPRFAPALEITVGAMLVLLGLDVLRRLRGGEWPIHTHRPRVNAAAHTQVAVASSLNAVPRFDGLRFAPRVHVMSHPATASRAAHAPMPLRALIIGVMHGMAGSAALILLTLQQAPSLATGLGYLLLFGLGSIAGMAVLSMLIATPLRMSAGAFGSLHRWLTGTIGLVSVAIGAWTIIEIAITA